MCILCVARYKGFQVMFFNDILSGELKSNQERQMGKTVLFHESQEYLTFKPYNEIKCFKY